MNFTESVKYLYGLGNEVEAMKLGLENIGKLLAALGKPQKNYFKIQVAGTNGKGSTVAFLEAIGIAAGLHCGATMSPHLVSVTERVRINGIDIGEDEFARAATLVRETAEMLVEKRELETVPTYFEQVTAIALKVFADAGVEIAILETGIGGRFDAITAARAEMAAITAIDLDHQRILGETIAEIAFEKASIIGPHTKMAFSVPQKDPSANAEIEKKCAEAALKPIWATAENLRTSPPDRFSFSAGNVEYNDISLALAGKHQLSNAVLAIAIAAKLPEFGFDVSTDAIKQGLKTARHHGRLEYCGGVLLDGAHNSAGGAALREFLNDLDFDRLTLIFGAMADKNLSAVTAILFPLADRVILTKANNSRSAQTAAIIGALPENVDKNKIVVTVNIGEALKYIADFPLNGELVCVTGSLYLVGEARKILSEEAAPRKPRKLSNRSVSR